MGLLSQVLNPASTWNETACICGFDLRVPSRLGGRKGLCPRCGRTLITSGTRVDCPSAAATFEANHPEREAKRLYHEPNFANAESAYAIAQRHSAIPGVVYLVATIGLTHVVLTQPRLVDAAIGVRDAPGWVLPVWLLACWLAVATCTATSVLVFRRITGRTYAEDRVMFSEAGGYDLARWPPLVLFIALFIVCARPPGWIPDGAVAAARDPWRFVLIGMAAGHIATWLAAWRVFHCRFERSTAPPTETRSEMYVAINR